MFIIKGNEIPERIVICRVWVGRHEKANDTTIENRQWSAQWTTASGKLWTTGRTTSLICRLITMRKSLEALLNGRSVYKYKWGCGYNLFRLILILSSLSAFEFSCDTNGVHKVMILWWLHFLWRGSLLLRSKHGIPHNSKSHEHEKEVPESSYFEAIN